MSLVTFTRRPQNSESAAPIKGYSRKGFVIGWVAIIALGTGGYLLASTYLSPSHAKLHLTNIAGDTYTVIAPN